MNGLPLASGWEEIGGNTFGSVPIDILVVPTRYSLILNVPGLTKSDIEVLVEENKILVVNAGSKPKWQQDVMLDEEEQRGVSYLLCERKPTPKFNRRFCLPGDTDLDAVSAKCENGVLTVTIGRNAMLPEKPAEAKDMSVTIQ